jgi:hypothetical protein
MRKITTLLGLALAFTAACGMGDATAPSATIEGSYSLRTVNGASLPYSFSSGYMLMSETLTLRTDGTYDDVGRYDDGTTTTEIGYYTASNGAVTFHDQTDNIVYQGSISGNVLTEISGGFTAVYQKN